MLWAVQISALCACLKAQQDVEILVLLICPNTGSTICFRNRYRLR